MTKTKPKRPSAKKPVRPNSKTAFKVPRFWIKHRWIRVSTYLIGGTIALSGIIVLLNPVVFPPVKTYNFGTSFSPRRSTEMGLDWKANYVALLDDLEIKNFRLMSYWDDYEPTRGEFNFADLDWQMDQAAKRNAQVSLAIGLRQPRWPECHQPDWALQLKGNEWKQALYSYIETVVKRYENHPALKSWQLENEHFNKLFGHCETHDRQRFTEEFELVKRISKKPVWVNLSDQYGLPIRGPKADAYGYSIYRIVYNTAIVPTYWYYISPIWYHRAKAVYLDLRFDKPAYIHELQLEPWGPRDTTLLSLDEQNTSMGLKQIHKNVTFARQLGFNDIYTWGSEWWYWRMEKFNDDSVWETVRAEIVDSKQ